MLFPFCNILHDNSASSDNFIIEFAKAISSLDEIRQAEFLKLSLIPGMSAAITGKLKYIAINIDVGNPSEMEGKTNRSDILYRCIKSSLLTTPVNSKYNVAPYSIIFSHLVTLR